MGKVNNKNQRTNNTVERRRWFSIVGFLCSVTLLSVAIFLSINQEQSDKLALINETVTTNVTKLASSELSKSVNEVKSSTNSYEPNPIILNETTNNIVKSNSHENEVIKTTTEISEMSENNKNETTSNEQNEDTQNEQNKVNNEKVEEKQEKKQFIMPVEGEIYKSFSMDSLVYSDTLQEWVTHRGIDIKADMETEVKAASDGVVKSIKSDPRYGLSVTIEHKDGFSTTYTCLVEADQVQEGDNVKQGQAIGKVGNSGVFEVADGSHLHFEMTQNGKYINPEMYVR